MRLELLEIIILPVADISTPAIVEVSVIPLVEDDPFTLSELVDIVALSLIPFVFVPPLTVKLFADMVAWSVIPKLVIDDEIPIVRLLLIKIEFVVMSSPEKVEAPKLHWSIKVFFPEKLCVLFRNATFEDKAESDIELFGNVKVPEIDKLSVDISEGLKVPAVKVPETDKLPVDMSEGLKVPAVKVPETDKLLALTEVNVFVFVNVFATSRYTISDGNSELNILFAGNVKVPETDKLLAFIVRPSFTPDVYNIPSNVVDVAKDVAMPVLGK